MPFLWCICDACVTELSNMEQAVRADVRFGNGLKEHGCFARSLIQASLPHMLARNAARCSVPSLSHLQEARSETMS